MLEFMGTHIIVGKDAYQVEQKDNENKYYECSNDGDHVHPYGNRFVFTRLDFLHQKLVLKL